MYAAESEIDILDEFSATAAQSPERECQERTAPEGLSVLQQEERKNRNQDKPGQVTQELDQTHHRLTDVILGRCHGAGHRLVDGVTDRDRNAILIDEKLPTLEVFPGMRQIRGRLARKRCELIAQLRQHHVGRHHARSKQHDVDDADRRGARHESFAAA